MNKKGFTLIELLVTIVITSLILALAVVSLKKISDARKEEAWNVVKKQIEAAAVQYFQSNSYLFESIKNNDANNVGKISVGKLVDLDYLDKVINPKDGKEVNPCSIVTVKNIDNKYLANYDESNSVCPNENLIEVYNEGAPTFETNRICKYKDDENIYPDSDWCYTFQAEIDELSDQYNSILYLGKEKIFQGSDIESDVSGQDLFTDIPIITTEDTSEGDNKRIEITAVKDGLKHTKILNYSIDRTPPTIEGGPKFDKTVDKKIWFSFDKLSDKGSGLNKAYYGLYNYDENEKSLDNQSFVSDEIDISQLDVDSNNMSNILFKVCDKVNNCQEQQLAYQQEAPSPSSEPDLCSTDYITITYKKDTNGNTFTPNATYNGYHYFNDTLYLNIKPKNGILWNYQISMADDYTKYSSKSSWYSDEQYKEIVAEGTRKINIDVSLTKDGKTYTKTCHRYITIDKTKPSCTLDVTTKPNGKNGWYKGNSVTLDVSNVSDNSTNPKVFDSEYSKMIFKGLIKDSNGNGVTSVKEGSIDDINKITYKATKLGNNVTYTAYVYDKTGNEGKCSKKYSLESEVKLTLDVSKTANTVANNNSSHKVFNTSKGATPFSDTLAGKCRRYDDNNNKVNCAKDTTATKNYFGISCINVDDYTRYFKVTGAYSAGATNGIIEPEYNAKTPNSDNVSGSLVKLDNSIIKYTPAGKFKDYKEYIYTKLPGGASAPGLTRHIFKYTSPAGNVSNAVGLFTEYSVYCGY